MKSFIANIEDLLRIKTLYKQCTKNHENVIRYKKKGAGFKEMLQYIKVGKNRKRPCPLVLNH